MNLADAIRKAANKGLVDGFPAAEPQGRDQTAQVFKNPKTEEKSMNNLKSVFTEIPANAPEPPQAAVMSGNAIRLEIFLSGEQMAGMLKAIMAGQHSVLTVREAASYLRIGPSRLEKLVEEGEIPFVEIDGRYRFPKSNLDDWLAVQSAANEEEKDVA